MNDEVWQHARNVVWATSQKEIANAQAQLWQAVAPNMDLYHLAVWRAGLEKIDYLKWERERKRARQ